MCVIVYVWNNINKNDITVLLDIDDIYISSFFSRTSPDLNKNKSKKLFFGNPQIFFGNRMYYDKEVNRLRSLVNSNVIINNSTSKHLTLSPIRDGFYLLNNEIMKCAFCEMILETADPEVFHNIVQFHEVWNCKGAEDQRNIPMTISDIEHFIAELLSLTINNNVKYTLTQLYLTGIHFNRNKNNNNNNYTIDDKFVRRNVFKYITNRVNSFKINKWPNVYSSHIIELSHKGFWYNGKSDIVVCQICCAELYLVQALDHSCITLLD